MFECRFGGPHLVGGGAVVEKSATFSERERENETVRRAREYLLFFFVDFMRVIRPKSRPLECAVVPFFCTLVPFLDVSR